MAGVRKREEYEGRGIIKEKKKEGSGEQVKVACKKRKADKRTEDEVGREGRRRMRKRERKNRK